jgi:hypothetical protein
MSNLQKWFLILAVWVIILALIFVFYWLAIRPAKIRQKCVKEAGIYSAEVKSSLSGMFEVNRAIYSDCLRRHGVER